MLKGWVSSLGINVDSFPKQNVGEEKMLIDWKKNNIVYIKSI